MGFLVVWIDPHRLASISFPPQHHRPGQGPADGWINRFKSGFPNPLEVKQQGEVGTNLLLCDLRRGILKGQFIRIAGQKQEASACVGEAANGFDVGSCVVNSHLVVTTAVKNKVERFQFGKCQHISEEPTYFDTGLANLFFGLAQRRWSDVDCGYVKSMAGKVNRVRSGTTTQIDGPTGTDKALVYHLLKLSGGPSRIPGRSFAPTIAVVPQVQHFYALRSVWQDARG